MNDFIVPSALNADSIAAIFEPPVDDSSSPCLPALKERRSLFGLIATFDLEGAQTARRALLHHAAAEAFSARLLGSRVRFALYLVLALATLVVHGYHPFAEDGGLYAAGIEHILNLQLFPYDTAFVTEHFRFSAFAPVFAAIMHSARALEPVLLLAYLGCTACTFAAADSLLVRLEATTPSRSGGLLLLFAWWTLPIAGTSLFLEDPYLTGRTLVMPLSLWAIAYGLDARSGSAANEPRRNALVASVCWLVAVAFHPLMTGYAFALFVCLLAIRSRSPFRNSIAWAAAVFLLAGIVQWHAAPESPAVIAASLSRYYWFLSRWQWFELLGLAGPLLLLCALLRWGSAHLSEPSRDLIRACLLLGGIAVLIAVAFAHAESHAHAVARLQPLRAFLMIYVMMILLLGVVLASWWKKFRNAVQKHLPSPITFVFRAGPMMAVVLLAGIMYGVQRTEFPASHHLEMPGRSQHSPNAWVQAFLWARTHTSVNALFSLDAHYISQPGEDAQTFRSIAWRSVLPDYSKDGGEASITPSLAETWFKAQQAQTGLASLSDTERKARLEPFGVDWLVLPSKTPTARPCPYDNRTVKVCRL